MKQLPHIDTRAKTRVAINPSSDKQLRYLKRRRDAGEVQLTTIVPDETRNAIRHVAKQHGLTNGQLIDALVRRDTLFCEYLGTSADDLTQNQGETET